jgi:hypothetical protein
MAIKDDSGRPQYVSILEFRTREISDAFSQSVIRAVLEHAPDAFDDEPQPKTTSRQSAPDADVPF